MYHLIISEIWSQVPLHSAKVTDKTISSHVISPRKLLLLYHIPLGDLSKQGIHLFYAFDCYKLSLQQASFVERRHWLLLHAWKENTSGDDSKDRAHTSVTCKGHFQAADFISVFYLRKHLFYKFVKSQSFWHSQHRFVVWCSYITRFSYEVWHSRLVYSLGIGCCRSAGCILM